MGNTRYQESNQSISEIVPFANVSNIAAFSTAVPTLLQELGHDIRTILPKYGFISERKYILREVIRLREIPFSFCNKDEVASAKSAFIPKTRVQVYFLESDLWFQPLNNLLYKSKNVTQLFEEKLNNELKNVNSSLDPTYNLL